MKYSLWKILKENIKDPFNGIRWHRQEDGRKFEKSIGKRNILSKQTVNRCQVKYFSP